MYVFNVTRSISYLDSLAGLSSTVSNAVHNSECLKLSCYKKRERKREGEREMGYINTHIYIYYIYIETESARAAK